MATRRFTKSAMDWAAFAARVQPEAMGSFRATKGKHEEISALVQRLPENMPTIDYAYYRSRLSNQELVDKMEQGMKGLNIPYPQDVHNDKDKITVLEKKTVANAKDEIVQIQQHVDGLKAYVGKLDSIPPLDKMTMDTYYEYFPEQALVREDSHDMTMYPHTKEWQPESMAEEQITHNDYSETKAMLKSKLGKYLPKY